MGTNDNRFDRAEARKSKRKKQVLIGKVIIAVLVLIILVLCFFLAKGVLGKQGDKEKETKKSTEKVSENQSNSQTETGESKDPAAEDPITQADRLAAMYDYDGAMELLKNSANYASDTKMQAKVSEYQATKDTCVEYPLDQVTHVFYHTLVVDSKRAFGVDDSTSQGINQVMTTVEEFDKITQSMYDKGYVMVGLHDMVTFDEQGNTVQGKILLPPDKKPFILSQDDVSYYHYMDGYGMASKLIIDENGKIKNEYVEEDGTVSVGDYDMVPRIDAFVEEHPDFSYRGAKGTIALTGYNGVLGYRTDIVYKTLDPETLDKNQDEWLKAHPDFDYDQDVAQATKVAEAMKAEGWTFGSHTWGHRNVTNDSLEQVKTDNEKWQSYVKPIIGDTDIIIFAFGADIGSIEPYTDENTDGKFSYLKEQGFNIFCNVDSSQYWVQIGENYMRQGRRNLDGYRMYYGKDLVSDLFDAEAVFDKARPTPVPEM